MKKSISIFAVLLLIFGYFSYDVKDDIRSNTGLAYSEGDELENFTLPDIQGNSIALDSVIAQNKYVWVNFWASWCGPCRREMPMMAELYEEYKDEGFSIVAVNVGEDSSAINNYLSDHPVPFTILLDSNEEITTQFNIEVLPTSFLIDSTGTVERVGTGIQRSWEFAISRNLEN